MLTEIKIKRAKAKATPYKLTDSGGLYLYVSTTGARSWRYDFRHGGKRQTLTLGLYPDLPSPEARKRHQQARELLKLGQNPAEAQKARDRAATATASTFKAVAELWYSRNAPERSRSWKESARRWLDKEIYPAFGDRPVREIRAADVLAIMRKLDDAGKPGSADVVRRWVAQIFDYAVVNLLADFNPARGLRKAIVLPKAKNHRPLTEKEIPLFLDAVADYNGVRSTKIAIRLLLLTFTRKLELLAAEWSEIDFDKAEWIVPAERMKGQAEHMVPLSAQALVLFRELKTLAGDDARFVLPSVFKNGKHMARDTLNNAFEVMGYAGSFKPHGVRATASTILNGMGWRPDVIEKQLAHVEQNKVRAAYNKAQYLPERRQMMQQWADHIDALCAAGKNVVTIRAKAAA